MKHAAYVRYFADEIIPKVLGKLHSLEKVDSPLLTICQKVLRMPKKKTVYVIMQQQTEALVKGRSSRKCVEQPLSYSQESEHQYGVYNQCKVH